MAGRPCDPEVFSNGVLREIAEYSNSFGPLGATDERIETSRFTLCMGAGLGWNTVQRPRFAAAELDDVLAEVHALLRERGRRRTQWEIGSCAQPANLVELLLARGLVRDRDPYVVAVVLDREPPPAPSGVVAGRVQTFEDYAAATQVQWIAFAAPANEIAEARASLRKRWRDSANIMHAAWIDGTLVCAGTSAPTPHGLLLYGGATLPLARGRGAYRALLRARWEEAVGRGTPRLITQGGAMSRPILERVGFRRVGHVHILMDRFDEAGN